MKPLSAPERLLKSFAQLLLFTVVVCIASPHFSEAGITLIGVTITSTEADPTAANPIPITFTFDEGVTGFEQSDITPTNGNLSNFNPQSTTVYSVDVEPLAEGSVEVAIAQGAAQSISMGDPSAADMFAIQFNVIRRPDLRIGKSNSAVTHAGDNSYGGLAYVQKKLKKKAKFFTSTENDGNLPDSINSSATKSSKFKANFRDLTAGGTNVTASMLAGTYNANYPVGATRLIETKVSPKKKSSKKQNYRSTVIVSSVNSPAATDDGSVLLKFLGEPRQPAGPSGPAGNNDTIGGNVIP